MTLSRIRTVNIIGKVVNIKDVDIAKVKMIVQIRGTFQVYAGQAFGLNL